MRADSEQQQTRQLIAMKTAAAARTSAAALVEIQVKPDDGKAVALEEGCR